MPDSADEEYLTKVPLLRLRNTAEAESVWDYAQNTYDASASDSSTYPAGCQSWLFALGDLLGWPQPPFQADDDPLPTKAQQSPCTLVILVINYLAVPLVKDDWAETGGYAFYQPDGAIPAMQDGMPGMGVFGVLTGSTWGPMGAIHFAPQPHGLPNGLTVGYRTYQTGDAGKNTCASFVKLDSDTASGVAAWWWENAKMDGSNRYSVAKIADTDADGTPLHVAVESNVSFWDGFYEEHMDSAQPVFFMVVRVFTQ